MFWFELSVKARREGCPCSKQSVRRNFLLFMSYILFNIGLIGRYLFTLVGTVCLLLGLPVPKTAS